MNNQIPSIDNGPNGTRSLRRAFSLLRILSIHAAFGWRLADLADAAGLDHSTVHRMLKAMQHERMVSRIPGTRRYTLGPLAYELGKSAIPLFSLDVLAQPLLSRLAADTRAIVFMNLRSGFDSVCIARHEGRRALKAYTVEVGTRRPLCVSAGGVAILISLPRKEQVAIERANLDAIASHGPARQRAVQRMVWHSRKAGYGFNQEDVIPGISAVGVPIRSHSGEPVASISLAALAADLAGPGRQPLLVLLRNTADAIEPMLGQLRF